MTQESIKKHNIVFACLSGLACMIFVFYVFGKSIGESVISIHKSHNTNHYWASPAFNERINEKDNKARIFSRMANDDFLILKIHGDKATYQLAGQIHHVELPVFLDMSLLVTDSSTCNTLTPQSPAATLPLHSDTHLLRLCYFSHGDNPNGASPATSARILDKHFRGLMTEFQGFEYSYNLEFAMLAARLDAETLHKWMPYLEKQSHKNPSAP